MHFSRIKQNFFLEIIVKHTDVSVPSAVTLKMGIGVERPFLL